MKHLNNELVWEKVENAFEDGDGDKYWADSTRHPRRTYEIQHFTSRDEDEVKIIKLRVWLDEKVRVYSDCCDNTDHAKDEAEEIEAKWFIQEDAPYGDWNLVDELPEEVES